MRTAHFLLGFLLVLSLTLHDLCNSKGNIHVQVLCVVSYAKAIITKLVSYRKKA